MKQLEKLYLRLSFARSAETINYLIERARLELIEPEFIEFEIAAQYKLDQSVVYFDPFE
jgi:hypothetical protein